MRSDEQVHELMPATATKHTPTAVAEYRKLVDLIERQYDGRVIDDAGLQLLHQPYLQAGIKPTMTDQELAEKYSSSRLTLANEAVERLLSQRYPQLTAAPLNLHAPQSR